MVMMYKPETDNYPNLAVFVKRDLLKRVTKKPRVFKAFTRFGQFTPEDARIALSWSSNPIILIIPLTRTDGSPKRWRYGNYDGHHKNFIYIDAHLASVFEKCMTQDSEFEHELLTQDFARDQARLFAEAIILHETVHWGDYTEDFVHDDFGGESGEAFERVAYGEGIKHTLPRFGLVAEHW